MGKYNLLTRFRASRRLTVDLSFLFSNFVIDAPFAESYMRDPQDLLVRIKLLTGVLEVGLFCSMCKSAYFGAADGTISIK